MHLAAQSRSSIRKMPTECAGLPSALDAPAPLRFDRRREPRIRTGGWAQVVCLDPLKVFLGGTMELADVSPSGIALLTDRRLEPGDAVEVGLAPFRVRGRLGVVVNCQRVELTEGNASPATPPRYRIGVRYPTITRAA
jgi:hypothetical protein